jgi:hypothetical protein
MSWTVSPVLAAKLPVDREYAVALEAKPLALTRIPLIVPGKCVREELEREVGAAAESCVVVDRGRCPSIFFAWVARFFMSVMVKFVEPVMC